MAERPLRVGIIGVGWGSVVQTPAFRMVPQFEVAALCSRSPERVATAGQKLQIDDVSTDWAAFVQRDDLDVISIATPVDLHREMTLAAIAAGKHVLVEKPVGLSSAETGEMLAAAQTAGVQHAVCFESRWEPARLEVRRRVEAGHLGTPYLALARSGADFWHPTRGVQSEWMYRTSEGGGYLMGMGSHDLDFACALFGEPVAVMAAIGNNVPQRQRADGTLLDVDADDTAVVTMRMASGMIVNVITTATAYGANFRAFDAFGSAGSLSIDGAVMGDVPTIVRAASVVAGGDEPVAIRERRAASGVEPPARRAAAAILSLALMLEDWLPAFDGAPADVPTLVDGHRVARVIDAARASAEGGGWVAL